MDERLVLNMVRIGIVSALRDGRARVEYPGTRNTSGWLFVLSHYTPSIKVGSKVLVLNMPIHEGEGFILGGY